MPARAQDADTTDAASDIAMYVQLPDSVVVTATRQKADARLTGRRVSVWTQADIQALPVSSFDELLRTVGGVEVRSRGAGGSWARACGCDTGSAKSLCMRSHPQLDWGARPAPQAHNPEQPLYHLDA